MLPNTLVYIVEFRRLNVSVVVKGPNVHAFAAFRELEISGANY